MLQVHSAQALLTSTNKPECFSILYFESHQTLAVHLLCTMFQMRCAQAFQQMLQFVCIPDVVVANVHI